MFPLAYEMNKRCLNGLALLFLILYPSMGRSQQSAPLNERDVNTQDTPGLFKFGESMFFDAEVTEFSRDGVEQVFRGDVVAVGSGALITADKIRLNQKLQELIAEGHVIIITTDQIYLGDKVRYHLKTGDFLLINSVMIANDPATAKKYSEKVLGFTPAELDFEQKRRKRLEVIEKRKAELRKQYLEKSRQSLKEPDSALIDQYALLLEQEDLTRNQENPLFAKMNQDRRERIRARRYHWQKGLAETQKKFKVKRKTSFFRLEGKQLQRKDNNYYIVEDPYWTPCKCDEDETASWGIRATRIVGEMEGYFDFQHPILEIKGIPVLYLPYLKVPVKEKRQSGLLPPTFSQRADSGNIYSQPIYFVWRDDFDMTVTPEIYEKRGTKLGLELRQQLRQYSGWRLNIAGMRDQVWLEDRRNRIAAREYYFGNGRENIIKYCREKLQARRDAEAEPKQTDPDNVNLIAQCVRAAETNLSLPSNTWRYQSQWQALSILAPRASFVTSGQLLSDHRYIEDLTLYEDFESALSAQARASLFSTAGYAIHLDGKDVYLGVSGTYGDNVLSTKSYAGQQLPVMTHVASRYFSLFGDRSNIPLYAALEGRSRQIKEIEDQDREDPQLNGFNKTLGDGYWQQLKLHQIYPIAQRWFVNIDQFSEWEYRHIAHSKLEKPFSRIQTWRTGLAFKVPLDGEAKISDLFSFLKPNDGDRYMRHYMEWGLELSVRPAVVRRGPYGEFKNLRLSNNNYVEGGELVYFSSDRHRFVSADSDISQNDAMEEHRRVSFHTLHTWDFFTRGWVKRQSEVLKKKGDESHTSDYFSRAKKELLYSLDRPVSGFEEIYDETEDLWLINRYQRVDMDSSRAVIFSADISYDFIQEKLRQEAKEKQRQDPSLNKGQLGLPQPWSEPRSRLVFNLFDFNLANSMRYNLYLKQIMEQNFNLGLPTLAKTKVGFGYDVLDTADFDQDSQTLIFLRTTTRYVTLNSSLIPHFGLSSWLGRRQKGARPGTPLPPSQYQTIFGVVYYSPSECWQLAFQRQKKYELEEKDAEYLLKLSVLFLGQSRSTPDLSPSIVRELEKDNNTL